jgi:glycosyltransferase involved in cell wall biosynthesis
MSTVSVKSQMRILHVMPSMNPSFGGPVAAIHAMAHGLLNAGVGVDIVTVDGHIFSKAFVGSKDGVQWRSFPVQFPGYGVSLPLLRWLLAHIGEYDLVHIHGVFHFASFAAAFLARRAGVPYVVRPLGILNRWGMERGRSWLKQLIFKWVEKPGLDTTNAMHFTSDEEAADVARLKIKAPGFVIPLGIDLSPYQNLPPLSLFESRFPDYEADKTILFLSRIDAKKGLDILLTAFKEVKAKVGGVKLIIAGEGDPLLMAEMKMLAEKLSIADSIMWTGFLTGRVRLKVLAKATVFCLPSHSENFGMALLEAMAGGLPCVTTDQVALSVEAAKAGAVHVTKVDAESLTEGLITLLTNEKLCEDLSEKAQKYAAEYHSMAKMAARLKKFYEQVCFSSRGRSSGGFVAVPQSL